MKRTEAIKRALKNNYISKNTIKLVIGCSHDIADKIFLACKEVELEKAPVDPTNRLKKIDARPFRVPTNIFMKTMNQDFNFLLKQVRTGEELNGQ